MEEKKKQLNKEELILEQLCKSISETSEDNIKIKKLYEIIKDLDQKIANAKESISDKT